ncbi:MAG: hypothetical protein MZV70_60610 [Desulfobacterales bacterium]|nr:hypothetical protein [Desulfobacterales bacterium]
MEKHPQLFGTYITNFSCGPDSFVIGYFRDIMGRKPSLTLELDSHTADAGLETRVEAFLDIVKRLPPAAGAAADRPRAERLHAGPHDPRSTAAARVVTSSGEVLPMTDPRVTVLIPSMGRLGSEAAAAILQGYGLHAKRRPRERRGHSEARPRQHLLQGVPAADPDHRHAAQLHPQRQARRRGPGLLHADRLRPVPLRPVRHLHGGPDPPPGDPGRRSAGAVLRQLLRRHGQALRAARLVGGDRLGRHGGHPLDAAGERRRPGRRHGRFSTRSGGRILARHGDRPISSLLTGRLAACAERLRRIALQRPPRTEVPTISLTGEIFVRRDALSRQYLTERLAEKGFATVCAPVAEWVHYCNYLVRPRLQPGPHDAPCRSSSSNCATFSRARYEKQIKSIAGALRAGEGRSTGCGDRDSTTPARICPPTSTGEAVLTVGGSLAEIIHHACGVIAIGPFGCMPNRLSEAILSETMTAREQAGRPTRPTRRCGRS